MNKFKSLLLLTLLGACGPGTEQSDETATNDTINSIDSTAVKASNYMDAETYAGAINEKYHIIMELESEGNQLKGQYYYTNVGTPIELSGSVEAGTATLKEFDENGTHTGTFIGELAGSTFSGELSGTSFTGTWSKPGSDKGMPFKLAPTNEPFEPAVVLGNIKVITKTAMEFHNPDCEMGGYVVLKYLQVEGMENEDIQDEINQALDESMEDSKIQEIKEDMEYCLGHEASSSVSLLNERLLSVSSGGATYGGAHPYYAPIAACMTFDLTTGELIKLSDLIYEEDLDDFEALVNKIGADDDMLGELLPLTVTPNNVYYLTEDGLVLWMFQGTNFEQWISASGFPLDLTIPYDELCKFCPGFCEVSGL